MGTKNQPGHYDCYGNAEPDEPMFIVLARDVSAPAVVRDWADRRELMIDNGQKLNRYRDGINGNTEAEADLNAKLRREIGDTFVYLDLMAQRAGFKLSDAAREVFNNKSDKLGYPGRV